MTDRLADADARPFAAATLKQLLPLAVVPIVGVIGYILFPDDLAFLTRLVGLTFLVLSLDLVTGYCGVATLGHAAIFGVSAYAVGNACLAGLTDPLALLVVGIAAGSVTGLLSGAIISRFKGLPQLVLSIATGQLTGALANKLTVLTGGSDGLSGIEPGRLLGIFAFDMYGRVGYIFSVAVLALVFAALRRFVASPSGLLCRAIKDDSLRARMIGARIYPRLVIMYGISGAVAGVGGALTAINTGVVALDGVSFERSAETLVMLVVGGAGNLWGALFGSIVFQLFEHFISAANPFHWMIMLGALLIAVVLFAPEGLTNMAVQLSRRASPHLPWRRR